MFVPAGEEPRMRDAEPVTRTMTVAQAHENWSEAPGAVSRRRERVVLERDGRPVAMLVSAADFEQFQFYEAKRAEQFAVLGRMRAAFADVPDDELEREVARAIAEVRAERRAAERAAASA